MIWSVYLFVQIKTVLFPNKWRPLIFYGDVPRKVDPSNTNTAARLQPFGRMGGYDRW